MYDVINVRHPCFWRNVCVAFQTLKKLKGKQEENKKREMSRLMSKLDAQEKSTPPITPGGGPLASVEGGINPEDTVR